MEDLRRHPFYQPLPHPDKIRNLTCLEDVRKFRQDSWQWNALHNGRCTASQTAAALGFLEPSAGKFLGIPRSLQSDVRRAYHQLSQPALRSLEEMKEELCVGKGNEHIEAQSSNSRIWKQIKNRPFPFAAKYYPTVTKSQLKQRREETQRYMSTSTSSNQVRMRWGNAQEATSILTALNYFTSHHPGVKFKEVGMCGAGLGMNDTSDGGLIIGASPDSIIEYPSGRLEVLEVKNHCPFVDNKNWRQTTKEVNNKDAFRVRDFTIHESVPPAYISQLMMEMMCLGEQCTSAVMVRQTATSGAIILRMHRDDEWISEMMYWLQKFTEKYVEKDESPPVDFFWNDDKESKRYKVFLQRTKELSERVELVKRVDHHSIQRMLGENNMNLPLFLDRIR